jgi:flavin-dependent dehydrogenase
MEAEVAIIGGGPAGSAAAITCATGGLRVVLVEAEPFPRDLPGESLHPGVEPLLERLGVREKVLAAGFPRYPGQRVALGTEPPRVQRFGSDAGGEWLGFQAWRATFDALLLERARELGVCALQPCRALAPLRREGRVVGVETSAGEFHAPLVIDASGRGQWLRRTLGLESHRASPPLLVWFGHARGERGGADALPSFRCDASGWVWTAPVAPGLHAWARLPFHKERLEPGWLPPELEGLRPWKPASAADTTWRLVVPSAGAGYFLVGDAASVVDPAASHGVLKALMSGMLAAHHAVALLRRQGAEHEHLRAFRDWTEAWFQRDVATLRALYPAPPGAPP